jgi:hypothetical protein
MFTLRKSLAVAGLVGMAVLFAATPQADAWGVRGPLARQRTLPVYSTGVNPNSPFYNPINPLYRVSPGMTSQQALFNTYQPLYAASRLPPWMFGYNPYPSPILGGYGSMPYVPPVYYNPYATPYTGYYNPYAYAPTFSGTYNPYLAGY